MPTYPRPHDDGGNLTGLDFGVVRTFDGHIGDNLEQDFDKSADMWARKNIKPAQSPYEGNISERHGR